MLSARELKKANQILLDNIGIKVRKNPVTLLTYCYYYIWKNTIKIAGKQHNKYRISDTIWSVA